MSSGSDLGAGQLDEAWYTASAPAPTPQTYAAPERPTPASQQPPPPFITLQSRTLNPGDGAPGPSTAQSPGVGRDGDNAYAYSHQPNHHQHTYYPPYHNNYDYRPQHGDPYNGYHAPYPTPPAANAYYPPHPPPPGPMSGGPLRGPVYPSQQIPAPKPITHDISRARYHVKQVGHFADTLEESAKRAFPNRGRSSRRYNKVFSIMIRWESDDLDVLSELEDLETCFRRDYCFETERFIIPTTNSHLDLMLRIGQLIKDHEAPDALLIVYYGGHAKIDEARQSTWVATRQRNSPWLQWSAIQTLLERSASDVLLLLDCCSGAASASFPTGSSITEAISASSWDAIAPEPGLYSFTNILIEVLQEWRNRAFSVAMLHAEMLARLKHPRPIVIQGKLSEVRATPVHFMMTANHKAPSIEITCLMPDEQPVMPMYPSPPALLQQQHTPTSADSSYRPGSGSSGSSHPEGSSIVGTPPGSEIGHPVSEPNQDTPHVMISLALEEDQMLNVDAWMQWLTAFPALAKYVKVQGVFRSHSTLMLLSMPVMIWDMLPEDHATSFVAFIRSSNLAMGDKVHEALSTLASTVVERGIPSSGTEGSHAPPTSRPTPDHTSFQSKGTTLVGSDHHSLVNDARARAMAAAQPRTPPQATATMQPSGGKDKGKGKSGGSKMRYWNRGHGESSATTDLLGRQRESQKESDTPITKRVILNQVRSTQWSTLDPNEPIPECPEFAPHVQQRLEMYYKTNRHPNNHQKEYFASNLGIEPYHVELWYHHREAREKEALASGVGPEAEPVMISADRLDNLLQILPRAHRLVLDVRCKSSRQKHWIDDSVHFRTPAEFIERATLDQIGQAFSDQRDMDRFAQWSEACCLVVYADNIEFAWECPSAQALLIKLQSAGWGGRCFILAGRFGWFRKQFPQQVQSRKDSSSEHRPARTTTSDPVDAVRVVQEYEAWVEQTDRAMTMQQSSEALAPSAINDRRRATEDFERTLANEFTQRFPVLYKESHEHASHPPRGENTSKDKMADDEGSLARQAALVPHLERGLGKMRSASAVAAASGAGTAGPSSDAAAAAALAAKVAAIEGESENGASAAVASRSRTPLEEYVTLTHSGNEDNRGGSSSSINNHNTSPPAVTTPTTTTTSSLPDANARGGHRHKKRGLNWRRVLGRPSPSSSSSS